VANRLDQCGLVIERSAEQGRRGAQALGAFRAAGADTRHLEIARGFEREAVGVLRDAAVLHVTRGDALEGEDVVTHRALEVTVVGPERDGHTAEILYRVDDRVRVEDAVLGLRPIVPELGARLRQQAENQAVIRRHPHAREDSDAVGFSGLGERRDIGEVSVLAGHDHAVEPCRLGGGEERVGIE